MAIQNRRGVYSDFTPSKMVPGELAVVQSGDPNNTSGKAVYAAFGASGDVKRLATEDDLGSVNTALGNKVDKVSGKGLSTNDYTTEEKNKLSGIEAQANKTVIDSTLTQTGQAADAKAVGDAIDSVTIETDKTLTEEDVPADAKVVGDELASVKSDLVDMQEEIEEFSGGLTPEIKVALLNCFEKVGWIDDNGQSYYDALEAALYADNIDHIEAVLSLGTHQVIMGDDLDSLRDYLTVTVYYQDETQEVVTNYELSGDISTEGTKTITVTLGRKSTTFTCSVEWGYRLKSGNKFTVGGLSYNYAASSFASYFDTAPTNRFSNVDFLPWETGYDCYVEADTQLNVVVSVNCYNEIAMSNVANHQNMSGTNVGRPGWQSSNPSLSVIPNSVNNSTVKTIRVTFKTVPTESTFSANSISEVRITRRAKS